MYYIMLFISLIIFISSCIAFIPVIKEDSVDSDIALCGLIAGGLPSLIGIILSTGVIYKCLYLE